MLRAPRGFLAALTLPALIVMIAVVLFPLLYNFWLAFRNMSLYHFTDHTFVGFAQFQELLSQGIFWEMLAKSLIWTALNITFHVTFGLLLAIVLAGPVRGRGLYRTLLILRFGMRVLLC